MADPRPSFAFGGRLSLDLTWTLRYRAAAPTELLVAPDDLCGWVTAALAPARGPVSPDLLEEARLLREAIHDAARAVVDGRSVRPTDRSILNAWAERPGPYRRLERAERSTLVLRSGAEVESALAACAVDAVALLAADDGRLRVCEGRGCSLLFHDDSRPGRRRWCSTARCGNRVNTTAYRRRRTDASTRSS